MQSIHRECQVSEAKMIHPIILKLCVTIPRSMCMEVANLMWSKISHDTNTCVATLLCLAISNAQISFVGIFYNLLNNNGAMYNGMHAFKLYLFTDSQEHHHHHHLSVCSLM